MDWIKTPHMKCALTLARHGLLNLRGGVNEEKFANYLQSPGVDQTLINDCYAVIKKDNPYKKLGVAAGVAAGGVAVGAVTYKVLKQAIDHGVAEDKSVKAAVGRVAKAKTSVSNAKKSNTAKALAAKALETAKANLVKAKAALAKVRKAAYAKYA